MSETRAPELDKPNCAPGRNRTYDTRFRKTVPGLPGRAETARNRLGTCGFELLSFPVVSGLDGPLSRTLRGPSFALTLAAWLVRTQVWDGASL